jgi:rRNA maturation protein Rpf1
LKINEENGRPKILFTTSRKPTNRIRTFCRDLVYSIPNTLRINRGKLSLNALAEKALELGANRIVIIDRWKGGPGKIEFFQIRERLHQVPPLIYLKGVKLRREFDTKVKRVQAYAIVICNEENEELQKISDAISEFLQLPQKQENALKKLKFRKRRTIFCIEKNKEMQIRFTFRLLPQLTEVGPRIRLSHLIWEVDKK